MKKFSDLLIKAFQKKPGRRFLYSYIKINHLISENLLVKIIFSIIGIFVTIIGIALLFLPGPGILFLLLGALLLSVSSRKVAFSLDKLEHKIRATVTSKNSQS